MKVVSKEKVKIPTIMDREYSHKEISNMLHEQEKNYLAWKSKTHTLEQVWDNVKNRKNTFLTSNK